MVAILQLLVKIDSIQQHHIMSKSKVMLASPTALKLSYTQ
jgi:hypothetical protein